MSLASCLLLLLFGSAARLQATWQLDVRLCVRVLLLLLLLLQECFTHVLYLAFLLPPLCSASEPIAEC
jgi:hypothetical protein